MSSSGCQSRLVRAIEKFQELTLRGKFFSLVSYALFILFFYFFLKKNEQYYLYVPTGQYMVYIEYLLLFLSPIIAWRVHKKSLLNTEKCKYSILDYFKGIPFVHLVLHYFFTFLLMTMLFYSLGVLVSVTDKQKKFISYNVKVKSIGFNGSKACRGNMKTDFLDQIDIEYQTFFHKFIHSYSFDRICTRFSNSKQVLKVGYRVYIDVIESPWGLYVYKIP